MPQGKFGNIFFIVKRDKLTQTVDNNGSASTQFKSVEEILAPGVSVNDAFSALVVRRVESYVRDLEGVKGLPIYEMIVTAAERPLLRWAMDKCGNNQKAAAQLLGINRNTLRRKLRMHGFLSGDF